MVGASEEMPSERLSLVLPLRETGPAELPREREAEREWIWGVSEGGRFGVFWNQKPMMLVSGTGAVWSGSEKSELAAGPKEVRSAGAPEPAVVQHPGLWQAGQSEGGEFGVWRDSVLCMFVHQDGQVWSAHQAGYLKSSELQSAAEDIGAEDAVTKSGPWSYGQSSGGYFGIWHSGELKMYVDNTGRVWGSGARGFFDPSSDQHQTTMNQPDTIKTPIPLSSPGTSEAAPELETTTHWEFGESVDGHFGLWLSDVPVFFVHSDGALWGARDQGYMKVIKPDSNEQSAEPRKNSSIKVKEWTIGESEAGDLGLWLAGDSKWLLSSKDGKLWASGPSEAGWLATDSSTSPPILGVPTLWTRFGSWQIGRSSTGNFGAWYKGVPKLVVTPEADMWTPGKLVCDEMD